jgi:hypothetical protein
MKNLFILLIIVTTSRVLAQTTSESSTKPAYLPSVLIDGRFYLKIPTINGDTILGFCDTGGGFTAIYNATIKKLHLESKISTLEIDGEKTQYILSKDLFKNEFLPYPQINKYFQPYIQTPFFEVPEETKQMDFFSKYVPHDVFLGQFFFINNSWTFDYTTGKIFINTPLSNNLKEENVQGLGFKKEKNGNKRFGHPSMKLEIDGKIIDFLFDTGATLLLSENGRKEFREIKKSVGGSFIAKSLFDKWHEQHPEWKTIEKGEITGADLIEVPQVKVGNLIAGPVWFAKRPDEAWSKGMIGSMDKIVKGAIGGSFLQYFKVTIDYNSELIKFEAK